MESDGDGRASETPERPKRKVEEQEKDGRSKQPRVDLKAMDRRLMQLSEKVLATELEVLKKCFEGKGKKLILRESTGRESSPFVPVAIAMLDAVLCGPSAMEMDWGVKARHEALKALYDAYRYQTLMPLSQWIRKFHTYKQYFASVQYVARVHKMQKERHQGLDKNEQAAKTFEDGEKMAGPSNTALTEKIVRPYGTVLCEVTMKFKDMKLS